MACSVSEVSAPDPPAVGDLVEVAIVLVADAVRFKPLLESQVLLDGLEYAAYFVVLGAVGHVSFLVVG